MIDVLSTMMGGDAENESIDVTHYFQDILDDGEAISVPVRRNSGGSVISYRLKDLDIPTGGVIICDDSKNVRLRGFTTFDNLITTTGSIGAINIIRGEWGYAKNVWEHTGAHSIYQSVLDRMALVDSTMGVNFSASSGVTFEDVSVHRCDVGFQFAPTPAGGYIAANNMIGCQFFYNRMGIYLTGNKQKGGMTIHQCWFEFNNEGAIVVEDYTYKLLIEGNYFERNGGSGYPDVSLSAPTVGSAVRSVTIANNYFAAPHSGQICRVKNADRASFKAFDNHAFVLAGSSGPQIFAECGGVNAGGIDYEVRLARNTLHSGTIRNYEVALYNKTGSQTVTSTEPALDSQSVIF